MDEFYTIQKSCAYWREKWAGASMQFWGNMQKAQKQILAYENYGKPSSRYY